MAVLSAQQKGDHSEEFAQGYQHGYSKTTIFAAVQAVEDVWEGGAVQSALNTAINTATAPVVMTAPDKQRLVKMWFKRKIGRL